jgi:hypothetical protein
MTKSISDFSWVPKREWQWGRGQTTCGVHTYEGKLVWWETPGGPNGHLFEVGSEQSFQDFIQSGPLVSAPPEVLQEIDQILRQNKPS